MSGPGGHDEERLPERIDRRDLWRLVALARPHRRVFAWCLLLALLATACELAVPWATKVAIDRSIALPWREAVLAPDDPLAGRIAAAGAVASRDGRVLVEVARIAERDAIDLDRRGCWRDGRYLELPAGERSATGIEIGGRRFLSAADLSALPVADRLRLRHDQAVLLGWVAIGLVAALAVRFAINAGMGYLLQSAGQRIVADLRSRVLARLLRLPAAAYDHQPAGRLVTRATNDVAAVNELFTGVLVTIVRDALLIAGGMTLLFVLEWRLALVVLACTPLVLAVGWAFRKRARDSFREVRAMISRLNAFLAESIAGWRTVQASAQEERTHRRFQEVNDAEFRAGLRQMRINGIFMPLLGFAGTATAAAVLWTGGSGVMVGWLTLGGLVAFSSYIDIVFTPIRDLAEKHNLTQAAVAAGERIFQILDRPEEEPGGGQRPEGLGRIAFEDVWFRYAGADGTPGPWVLQGVSFTVAPGERIALVGATGSGKTTISTLLLAFHAPERGRITVAGGTDLQACARPWLRSRIATVQQDVHLFAGTVGSNIALFGDAGVERVAAAAATVHADAVAARLPGGMEHLLGERGGTLSSGERQLLALARAVAHQPELLILDEATAHIDSQTERLVQDGLARLLAGRSALIIAHRLSTIRSCDRILVLHHGRLAEQGSHRELLAAGGLYADLHRRFEAEDALAASPG